MNITRTPFALLALASCVGASEDPPRPLDCAWMRGDNCFKSVVAAAASCLPPLDAVGTLSEDGRACVFATGQTVVFDEPVTLPLPDDRSPSWNVTVRANGRECLRVYGPDTRHWTVSSPAGAAAFVGTSIDDLTLSCPDGSRYVTSDWNSLQATCGEGTPPSAAPGAAYTVELEPAVSYWLQGTGGPGGPGDPSTSTYARPPGSTHIFRCRR